jgi:hypothetical protein
MFSIVGFNKYEHELIKRWPSIRFTGIKDPLIKTDADSQQGIIDYLANYETKDEAGIAFNSWMKSLGINCNKPQTPVFKTHQMFKNHSIIERVKKMMRD